MSARAQQRRRQIDPTVVATLQPLHDSPAGRLDVRILDIHGERRVDIRQHVTAATFTGYTRKGVCLTGEEFDALIEQAAPIAAALAETRESRSRARRAPPARHPAQNDAPQAA